MSITVEWWQDCGHREAFDGLCRKWTFAQLADALLRAGAGRTEPLGEMKAAPDTSWYSGGEIRYGGFFVRFEAAGEAPVHGEILDFPDALSPFEEDQRGV